MKQCIMCGKKDGDLKEHDGSKITIQDFALPHGTIHLCTASQCKKLVTYKINFAVPVAWFSREDIYESNGNEFLPEEEAIALTDEDIVTLGDLVEDDIWNGGGGDAFNDHVESAIESWKITKEKRKIESTPLLELPLLIGNIEYNQNKKLLEERITKGE